MAEIPAKLKTIWGKKLKTMNAGGARQEACREYNNECGDGKEIDLCSLPWMPDGSSKPGFVDRAGEPLKKRGRPKGSKNKPKTDDESETE